MAEWARGRWRGGRGRGRGRSSFSSRGSGRFDTPGDDYSDDDGGSGRPLYNRGESGQSDRDCDDSSDTTYGGDDGGRGSARYTHRPQRSRGRYGGRRGGCRSFYVCGEPEQSASDGHQRSSPNFGTNRGGGGRSGEDYSSGESGGNRGRMGYFRNKNPMGRRGGGWRAGGGGGRFSYTYKESGGRSSGRHSGNESRDDIGDMGCRGRGRGWTEGGAYGAGGGRRGRSSYIYGQPGSNSGGNYSAIRGQRGGSLRGGSHGGGGGLSCFICGEMGHLEWGCPRRAGGNYSEGGGHSCCISGVLGQSTCGQYISKGFTDSDEEMGNFARQQIMTEISCSSSNGGREDRLVDHVKDSVSSNVETWKDEEKKREEDDEEISCSSSNGGREDRLVDHVKDSVSSNVETWKDEEKKREEDDEEISCSSSNGGKEGGRPMDHAKESVFSNVETRENEEENREECNNDGGGSVHLWCINGDEEENREESNNNGGGSVHPWCIHGESRQSDKDCDDRSNMRYGGDNGRRGRPSYVRHYQSSRGAYGGGGGDNDHSLYACGELGYLANDYHERANSEYKASRGGGGHSHYNSYSVSGSRSGVDYIDGESWVNKGTTGYFATKNPIGQRVGGWREASKSPIGRRGGGWREPSKNPSSRRGGGWRKGGVGGRFCYTYKESGSRSTGWCNGNESWDSIGDMGYCVSESPVCHQSGRAWREVGGYGAGDRGRGRSCYIYRESEKHSGGNDRPIHGQRGRGLRGGSYDGAGRRSCFICGESGHFAKDCSQRVGGNRNEGVDHSCYIRVQRGRGLRGGSYGGAIRRFCYICGEPEHFATECSQRTGGSYNEGGDRDELGHSQYSNKGLDSDGDIRRFASRWQTTTEISCSSPIGGKEGDRLVDHEQDSVSSNLEMSKGGEEMGEEAGELSCSFSSGDKEWDKVVEDVKDSVSSNVEMWKEEEKREEEDEKISCSSSNGGKKGEELVDHPRNSGLSNVEVREEDDKLSCSSSGEGKEGEKLVDHARNSSVSKVKARREEKKLREEEEDEECCILDFDPLQPPTIDSKNKHSLSSHHPPGFQEEDLSIIAERGQVACRDYPHSRHNCANYPFDKTDHESFCPQCYCYVCDVIAPCGNWRGSSGHCHASDLEGKWEVMRFIHRAVSGP